MSKYAPDSKCMTLDTTIFLLGSCYFKFIKYSNFIKPSSSLLPKQSFVMNNKFYWLNMWQKPSRTYFCATYV